MLKPIRRVVTGHDENRKAIVSMDGAPPMVIDDLGQPGLVMTEVWNTSECPVVIDNGGDPTDRPLMLRPTARGSVIRVVDLPSETQSKDSVTHEMLKDVFGKIGAADAHSGDPAKHPGMHRTETVDYGIVLEGEVTLILEGSEVNLGAGDIVVQRGTIHAWANRSGKPCRIAFVLLDGTYADEVRPAAAHD
ncbi:cupin domain-containing protein [Paraburkholderia tropica]|uniref:cupin domain-containing protein n=1 Tax=Paraburkholderia tropica TaxID=92647 RepID=UPI001615D15F|nr:cupin domain-containing protein [Paraburkholderia tropica]MBB2983404.1 quercetin dioxygenase-like cupin family protein [Paraburkholderia tropica]